jgi:hypothetical protein
MACSAIMARPNVTNRLRIGGVETSQDVSLEENAEHGDRERRDHHRRPKAEIFCDFDGGVGAKRVKRAMRQIDHAADAEDQRQPERNQQIIASEHEAIHHLFQQEPELHSRSRETFTMAARTAPSPGTSLRAG